MIDTFEADGQIKRKPMVKKGARVLMKNANTPISIDFQFQCPLQTCNACHLDKEQEKSMRKENKPLPVCVYARTVSFRDSYSIVPHSLDTLVKDLHSVSRKTGKPLRCLFKNTYTFAKNANFTDEQFQAWVQSKLVMPFNLLTDIDKIKSYTSPPPKHEFLNLLSNSNTPITDSDYSVFVNIWETLEIRSLLDLLWIYLQGN